MDAKGRIAIPARLREALVSSVVVDKRVDKCADGRADESSTGCLVITAHHDDPCLLVYTEQEWQETLPRLQALPNLNKAARHIQRRMIGYAAPLEMDGNGRVLLSSTLREFAGLEKKIMLVGQGHRLELWSEERWNARMLSPVDDVLPEELQNLSF